MCLIFDCKCLNTFIMHISLCCMTSCDLNKYDNDEDHCNADMGPNKYDNDEDISVIMVTWGLYKCDNGDMGSL